mgnify:CR=1 FL=1
MLFFELVKKLENNKLAQEQFENSAKLVGLDITFENYLPLLKKYIDGNKINGKMDMLLNIINDKIVKGESIMDILGIDNISKKQFAEVFTPIWLVNDMLDKLPEEVWSNPDFKWIDNSCGSGIFLWGGVIKRLKIFLKDQFSSEKKLNKHIANMIYGVDIQASNVAICRKYIVEQLGKENKKIIKNNIVKANSLEFDYWGGKKFNVVVGNPPYQDDSTSGSRKGGYGGRSLWDNFILKAFEMLHKNGYLVYVHPSAWRKPEHHLWKLMTSKQIIHLDIHSKNEGNKTFGASTRYDWYVLENVDCYKKTFVRCEDGKEVKINLKEWNFLPNYMIDEVKNILGEQEVIFSYSIYDTRKRYMKDKKKNNEKPVIHTMTEKGMGLYYTTENKGHFGIPKVVLSFNEKQYPYNDYNGKYGMSQITFGLPITSKEEGDNIVKAINSDKFKEIIKATKWSTFQTEWRMFKYFRKDFWKEFI